MGIFDKAREARPDHAGRSDPLVERLVDGTYRRTDEQHAHGGRAAEPAEDQLADRAGHDGPQPGQPG